MWKGPEGNQGASEDVKENECLEHRERGEPMAQNEV
jgi:hypothetical protein